MKRGNKDAKRGQLNISFGMIFSIILIIIFLAFGFFAIKKFVDLQSSVQIEQFMNDLQNDVDKMWKSVQGSQKVQYTLPTKITAVCFKEDEFENIQFTSKNVIHGKIIKNIDLKKIIENENPFCVSNVKGKVSFTIIKEYGETLVTITK